MRHFLFCLICRGQQTVFKELCVASVDLQGNSEGFTWNARFIVPITDVNYSFSTNFLLLRCVAKVTSDVYRYSGKALTRCFRIPM